MIFFLWTENERWSFSRNTWYFLYIRIDVTNRIICPSAKKIQRWSSPAKIHLKVIDILGWHSRKSSNNSLYLYGVPYRRFHILLSIKKNNRKLKVFKIGVWLLLQFIRLNIFYNEEPSILCTIQLSWVVFRGVLERQSRKLFVH